MLDSLREIAASKLMDHMTSKEKQLNNSRPRLEHFRMNKKSWAEDLLQAHLGQDHRDRRILNLGNFIKSMNIKLFSSAGSV